MMKRLPKSRTSSSIVSMRHFVHWEARVRKCRPRRLISSWIASDSSDFLFQGLNACGFRIPFEFGTQKNIASAQSGFTPEPCPALAVLPTEEKLLILSLPVRRADQAL